ncbi:MAG: SIS domain-containing protein [Clostridiales bacterium]|nr:SIS domain-containing protein [Clostridiales bacterium]
MTTLMQQEIFSEPKMMKRTIAACKPVLPQIFKAFKEKGITNIVTMARGTSDNAATVFSFVCPLLTGIKVGKYHPSLTTVYNADVDMKNTCMVIISQSGMSKDTVAVMEKAIANGAMTVAVTNNDQSPIAKRCDFHLFMDVEEEKSVAATKTYIGELFALYLLTDALRGNFDCKLENLADRIQEILDLNPKIAEVAKKICSLNNFIVLSRGAMLGTGDECALKLTECCYLFNRSYSSANFMHGPLSLVDDKANVIILAPDSEFNAEFIEMASRVSNLGANLTVFSNIPEVLDLASNKIVMPKADVFEAPVLYGTAISLLALNIGLAKGLNVDTPRNLNKVTITL